MLFRQEDLVLSANDVVEVEISTIAKWIAAILQLHLHLARKHVVPA
jgi:hypothetical protein